MVVNFTVVKTPLEEKPVWRENDEITLEHTEFEILMKYPSRTVQKTVRNADL